MKRERSKFDWYCMLTFLSALILRIIYYWQPVTHKLRSDDFGPLTYPAYLAGYQWTSYVAYTKRYYGYGYYWIFTPLFKLIHDSRTLLLAIVMINGLLILLCSVLIYELLVRYCSFPGKLETVIFALLPSLFQGELSPTGKNFLYRTDNEVPLYFVCWLMVWIILKAHKNYNAPIKKRIGIAVCTSVILCWGLTVHERALALVLAVFFAEILLYLYKRKWLLQPGAFFGSFAVGFLIQRYFRNIVINVIWAGNWPEKNTSAFSRVNLWFLESWKALKSLIIVFFGNLYNFILKGFGFPALAIVIVSVWIVKQLPVIRKKWFEKDEDVRAEWVDPYVLIMLIFGTCAMIIIAGLGVRWGALLYPGILSNKVVSGYKGICYSRYYYTFIGPVLFGVIAYCYHHLPLKRSRIEGMWGVFFSLGIIFFGVVYPYLVKGDIEAPDKNYIKSAMGIYILDTSYETRLVVSLSFIFIAMVLLTFALTPYCSVLQKGRKWLVLTVAFVLAVFFVDRLDNFDFKNASVYFYYDETSCDVIKELIDDEDVSVNIYIPNKKYSFPFLLRNPYYTFYNGHPSENQLEEPNMIISTIKEKEEYMNGGYAVFDIGYYWAYTNDRAAADILRNYSKKVIQEIS